jgi:hypothetical protein
MSDMVTEAEMQTHVEEQRVQQEKRIASGSKKAEKQESKGNACTVDCS